jgi:adenylosuccinate lyase
MLTAISPVDGRYENKTRELSPFFSEFALIKYRVFVEIQYFIALVEHPLPQLADFPKHRLDDLVRLSNQFDETAAERVKSIEKVTNHDVKAVEYYIKEQFDALGLEKYKEFIHFGLTSQDINNTATPLSLKHAMEAVLLPAIQDIIQKLNALSDEWAQIPMLARTHGQPASPTVLGKEFRVFVVRLQAQLAQLEAISYRAKFGGATGNFNAHYVAYPGIDWQEFGNQFVSEHLSLERAFPTTQIEHYDNLAAIFMALKRINTILIDFCRDVWAYISMDYFRQKVVKGEVGSSAMPHKVNPIDFENAEGNLGLANAVFTHLADKLPISRLQRDLTDSTVMRNIGVPAAHTLIALKSIDKGLGKLLLNEEKLHQDLENNWMVVAEAIQNVLRRESYPSPYEALKDLTRGNDKINLEVIHQFIDQLNITDDIKQELKQITPQNYIGKGDITSGR